MSEKQRIAKEVAEQRNRKKDIEKRMEVKNRLLANIGASLKQFDSMCEIVNDETAKAPFKKDRIQLPSGGWLYREKLPDPGEFDARKLIDALIAKVKTLTAAAAPFSKDLSMTNVTEALVCYGGLIARNMKFIQFETTITEECKKIVLVFWKFLIEGFFVLFLALLIEEMVTIDTALVPTREEIKRISAAIYKECSVDPDLLPVANKK